jgi:2-dehydro-3-deoxy-D-arabinonate dehydratase
MSSRSIEGENPLYLPQAKTYDGCAAVGPCIYVTEGPLDVNTLIHLEIKRKNEIAFTDQNCYQPNEAQTRRIGKFCLPGMFVS